MGSQRISLHNLNHRTSDSLSPCAGKCSTVFGDWVCRGCRRYQHEVDHWNRYSLDQRAQVWRRLDTQLDQVVLPQFEAIDFSALADFLLRRQIRLHQEASRGRQAYEALRRIRHQPLWLDESGLVLSQAASLVHLVETLEHHLILLGNASYEHAWGQWKAKR